MNRFAVSLAIVGALSAAVACTQSTADPLQRTLVAGVVHGVEGQNGTTWVWRGIPYAAPPVGDLRWRAPQTVRRWGGVRDARSRPPICPQLEFDTGWRSRPNVIGEEDCLYLDVYRPATPERDLPVYVWIHGGGNTIGDASHAVLENLSRKANLVAVAIQYRLNVFGYFTHPALRDGREPVEASGNFGLLDQVAALEWVRDNIRAFGGNPELVTIAGESAGGHNVMALMLSSLGEGLFHRAVMQSGGMVTRDVAEVDAIASRTIETALAMRDRSRTEIEDADGLSAFLYGLEGTELLQAHAGGPGKVGVPVGSVIRDGTVIRGRLLCQLEKGQYNRVPLMAGATADEIGSIGPIVPPFQALLDVIEGTKSLAEALPDDAARRRWQSYRHYGSAFWRAVFVDEMLLRVAPHQSELYAYSFDWGHAGVLPDTHEAIYGAAHGLEVPLFHGNIDAEGLGEWSVYSGFDRSNLPGRRALSDAIVGYLAQFVRTGDPNGGSSERPRWPRWSADPDASWILHLDATTDEAQITEKTDRITVADVRRALEDEPETVQKQVRETLGILQPYALHERGDYRYGNCD